MAGVGKELLCGLAVIRVTDVVYEGLRQVLYEFAHGGGLTTRINETKLSYDAEFFASV